MLRVSGPRFDADGLHRLLIGPAGLEGTVQLRVKVFRGLGV